MKDKVFVIGAHKTGTTSLKNALSLLKYKIFPQRLSYSPMGLIYDLEKENYSKIIDVAKSYEAFDDSPWNHSDFYKTLDISFPNSKFILTLRDTDNWIDSVIRWDKIMNLRNFKWYSSLSKTCYKMDSYLDDIKTLTENYEKRNLDIIDYFKSKNNLLLMDLEKGDGWEKLCAFLECEIPNNPFPHLNKTKK